jgi:hypothetical protein
MSGKVYKALILLSGAVLGYLALVLTVANATAHLAPSVALRFWPNHAVAQARMADTLIAANPRQLNLDRPSGHAIAALRRNPTIAAAARILGIRALLRRDEAKGARLFHYAASMSMRDVPTQLWLLEQQVSENHVAGALEHFRIVLRVSTAAQATLFPVLTSAMADPDLLAPIARRANGEPWAEAFQRFAGTNAADPVNAARLLIMLDRMGTPPPPDMLQEVEGRLVNAGRIDVAGRLYRLIDPRWDARSLASQLDGDFSRTGDRPLFGWTLASELAWRAVPAGAAAGNQALNVSARESVSSLVASRLMQLRPGRYRLDGRYGVVQRTGGWGIQIGIACAQGARPTLSPPTMLAAQGGAFGASFVVPNGCRAPWVSLSLAGNTPDGGIDFWVDDLRLQGERGITTS